MWSFTYGNKRYSDPDLNPANSALKHSDSVPADIKICIYYFVLHFLPIFHMEQHVLHLLSLCSFISMLGQGIPYYRSAWVGCSFYQHPIPSLSSSCNLVWLRCLLYRIRECRNPTVRPPRPPPMLTNTCTSPVGQLLSHSECHQLRLYMQRAMACTSHHQTCTDAAAAALHHQYHHHHHHHHTDN